MMDSTHPGDVILRRYNDNLTIFNKIYSLKYRFESVFGKIEKRKNPFDQLYALMQIILSAAKTIELHQSALNKIKKFESHAKSTAKRIQKLEELIEEDKEIIWTSYSENDPIEEELNEIIENIENICRPILQK